MAKINLIPESVRVTQAQHVRLKRWALSSAVAAGALLAALATDGLRRAKAGELHTRSERLGSELKAIRADLQSVTAEANEVLLQIERANALRSKRAWSGMFAVIASCLPADCWLASVATNPDAPKGRSIRAKAPAQAEPGEQQRAVTIDAPRALRISGYAPEASAPHAFVTALKDTQLFTRVVLQGSQREPVFDGSYFRFELACEW